MPPVRPVSWGGFLTKPSAMRKTKGRRHPDPNQMMLFTEEEMTGLSQSVPSPSSAPAVSDSPLADNSVTTMLLRSLCLLGKYSPQEVQLIAMQTAALIQGGIEPLQTYTLPSMPGIPVKGDMLAALAYASIAQSFPNMIDKIGLHWSSEYSQALQLYSKS